MIAPVNVCSLCVGYISTGDAYLLGVVSAVAGFLAFPIFYKLGALWKARRG
jgi:hypothetical protein